LRVFERCCWPKPIDVYGVGEADYAFAREARAQELVSYGCAWGDDAGGPAKQPEKEAIFPVPPLGELADIVLSRDSQ
jgi:hypothetical protein